ncbi:MAG: RnfH family protein, partial [Gammaproteobacteria bacterium]|nr:RnfH family protein [Gammaproteobacteria bacterium]
MESEMLVVKNPRQIIVEVAYAIPASQNIFTVEVNEGATV